MQNLSIIHEEAKLHQSVVIRPFCNIGKCKIGKGTKLGHNVYVGDGVEIGENCLIQGNVFIPPSIKILNNCFIAPGVTFCNVKHPPIPKGQPKTYAHTLINKGVSIGAGAIILPGITLNSGVIIGAGAVVTKSIFKKGTYVGNPAKELFK